MDQLHRMCLEQARLASPRARSVLEVGCAGGGFLRAIASTFPQAEVTGVDISDSALRKAEQRLAGEARISVARAAVESLPLPSASVDLVVAIKSFHHWEDWARGFREIERVMSEGASLVVADVIAAGVIRRPWLRRVAELLDGGRFVDEDAMDAMLRDAGLSVRRRVAVPQSAGAFFITVASSFRAEPSPAD